MKALRGQALAVLSLLMASTRTLKSASNASFEDEDEDVAWASEKQGFREWESTAHSIEAKRTLCYT